MEKRTDYSDIGPLLCTEGFERCDTMGRVIYLSPDDVAKGVECWIASHFLDGEPEASVIEIMGTHRIPTPYLYPAVDGEVVKTAIQKSNPDYQVILLHVGLRRGGWGGDHGEA